jgi:LL-diaminopimelate aminotransferase
MSGWSFSKRASSFKTLIFSELAAYKRAKQQTGASLIDLSIGSPDLGPPSFIMESLSMSVRDPLQYGYTLQGSPTFNQAVAHYYKKFNVDLNPDTEVIQVTGSQEGLVHLPMIYAEEGDLILVPDPGYTAYEAGVLMSGAALYRMPLKEEAAFLPDLEAIPEDVASRAKMMILNFPGNPVPALATEAFFKEAIGFAKKYNIIIVHDFAYCELVFDQHQPISFLSIEGAKEVGVEFNSLSKSFNMAGCRIGYVTGNSEVIQAFRRLKSNLDYGIFAPLEQAAIQALLNGEAFAEENRRLYQNRRDVFINGLREAGWVVDPPKASMFVWARIPKGWTSMDFAFSLIDKAGVVVTPGNAFGAHGEGFVRIAMVQPEEVLLEACQRIKIALEGSDPSTRLAPISQ